MIRIEIPASLTRILRETPELARAYLVGGCVRDALAGRPGWKHQMSQDQLCGTKVAYESL